MSDNANPGDDLRANRRLAVHRLRRLEGPQPCVGVCQDRKVTLVPADAYDAALARSAAEARLAALESLARRMALSTPRNGEWEKSFRALQDEARRAMREIARRECLVARIAGAPAQALAASAIVWASSNLATMQRLRPLRLAQ